METFFLPTEDDFKKWIKDAFKELLAEREKYNDTYKSDHESSLVNRREIANFLRISLVTLNDWTKRGLPSHKQRGRVYFDKKEVLDYIKEKKIQQFKMGSKLHHLR